MSREMPARVAEAVAHRSRGLSYKEIARAMQVDRGTVAQYMHRAHALGVRTPFCGRWAKRPSEAK